MIEYKQQTALEWYDNEIEKLFNQFTIDKINIYEFRTKRFKLLEQAKEMEKEQIINAFCNGDNTDCTSEQNIEEFADEWYNETYGGGDQ